MTYLELRGGVVGMRPGVPAAGLSALDVHAVSRHHGYLAVAQEPHRVGPYGTGDCGEVLATCEREASEHRFDVRPRCHVRIGTDAGTHPQKGVGRVRAKDGPLKLGGSSHGQTGTCGRLRGLKARLGAAHGYGLAREG